MGLNVADLQMADSAVLTVKNLRGDDDQIGDDGVNPVTIEVYSSGSEPGQKAAHREKRTSQPRLWRWMRGEFRNDDRKEEAAERVQKMVGVTKVINNWAIDPHALYGDPLLNYITKQVETFHGNDGNFAKGSSTS